MAGTAGTLAYGSPARFSYHPRDRARPRAIRSMGEGTELLVGERGERWLYSRRDQSLLAGSILAPEPLVAALGDAGGYAFIGASGTAYAAREPLGAFERSSAPVEALSLVSASGSSIIGVRQSRSLLRSGDFGMSWEPVGPEGSALVGVALEPSGRALGLASPEAFFSSEDFGAHWQKLAVPAIGALELVTALDGSVRALTPLGERSLERESGRWLSAQPVPSPTLGWPAPPRGPDAYALAEGRAALSGSTYVELLFEPRRSSWELLSGPLGEKLARSPLDALKGCRAARLAAFGRSLLLACFRESGESLAQPIELYRAYLDGAQVERLRGSLQGTLSAFRMALGAGGRWIVSGVCPPSVAVSGCSPSGVQHERTNAPSEPRPARGQRRGARALGALSASPSLGGAALALGFSTDGNTAYAVGRRTKTERFALFVSLDGGRSFLPRDLDLGQVASEDSEDDFVERSPGTRVESLSAAEDGAVAITFSHYGRRTLVVTDEQGKLLSSADPPEERAFLSASGLRAIAIAPRSRQLWESLDGGVTFTPAALLPLDLCPGEECEVPVRCAPAGCVMGRELSRVGWGGQSADEGVLLPPPLRPLRGAAERRLRTPIACTFDPAQRFSELSGVDEAPGAHAAALGGVAWYAVAEDPARAAVSVYHAKQGRVEASYLLEPIAHPEQRAYTVLGQVEGAAALRYRVPEAAKPVLSDVEVAWDNLVEGKLGRARLADGGPATVGDYVSSGSRAQRAQPDLLSIAAGGLYLRLHRAQSEQKTLFLDGQRVESLPAPVWPRDERFPARAEMIHVDGAHVPMLFVGRGAALVRAQRRGDGYGFDAYATGMIDPASFGLIEFDNITYVGDRAGLYVETQDGLGALAAGMIFPLRADGPLVDAPIAAPTQLSLGARPPSCDAQQRARSPRVVAGFQPGTRHPVVVSDSVDGPRTLLTGFAVLYGTPEAPCAAAFEATGLAPESAAPSGESALILLDERERSVLFRRSSEHKNSFEYRPMSCRFDPALEVPPEAYRAAR